MSLAVLNFLPASSFEEGGVIRDPAGSLKQRMSAQIGCAHIMRMMRSPRAPAEFLPLAISYSTRSRALNETCSMSLYKKGL